MAITKIQWYIGLIFFIGIITITFMTFGHKLAIHDKAILNDASKQYILDYSGYVSQAQFNIINDTDETRQQESLTGFTNETQQSTIQDFLGTINFYSTRVSKFERSVKLIYNLPTFVLLSMGLPITPFRDGINVLGYIFLIALIYLFVKIIRGS